jgi:leucyl aminopeptidase
MNFELKALTAAAAAREKCDLLLVLVSEQAASGTFGSDAIRLAVATPSSRSFPASTSGSDTPRLSHMKSMLPAIRSCKAGAVPR